MNINEALQALANNTRSQVVELRGERGDVGPIGPAGRDGRDAAPVQIKIGLVVSGDKPEARIKKDGDNSFVLDLCLPQGSEGPRGFAGLPSEVPGPRGEKGDTPTPEEIRTIVRSVVNENRDLFRGEKGDVGPAGKDSTVPGPRGSAGESIQGPRGEAGHSVNEEELRTILIKVLSDVGVLTEQSRKLIAVHAELRKALNKASSRNLGELTEVYRKIDSIITE